MLSQQPLSLFPRPSASEQLGSITQQQQGEVTFCTNEGTTVATAAVCTAIDHAFANQGSVDPQGALACVTHRVDENGVRYLRCSVASTAAGGSSLRPVAQAGTPSMCVVEGARDSSSVGLSIPKAVTRLMAPAVQTVLEGYWPREVDAGERRVVGATQLTRGRRRHRRGSTAHACDPLPPPKHTPLLLQAVRRCGMPNLQTYSEAHRHTTKTRARPSRTWFCKRWPRTSHPAN